MIVYCFNYNTQLVYISWSFILFPLFIWYIRWFSLIYFSSAEISNRHAQSMHVVFVYDSSSFDVLSQPNLIRQSCLISQLDSTIQCLLINFKHLFYFLSLISRHTHLYYYYLSYLFNQWPPTLLQLQKNCFFLFIFLYFLFVPHWF